MGVFLTDSSFHREGGVCAAHVTARKITIEIAASEMLLLIVPTLNGTRCDEGEELASVTSLA